METKEIMMYGLFAVVIGLAIYTSNLIQEIKIKDLQIKELQNENS